MPYNLSFYHHRYLAILLYYLSSMLLQIRPESSCLLWFSFFFTPLQATVPNEILK
nr:MAG TPA: hypothetical protein [Caudoviricetes sp.]